MGSMKRKLCGLLAAVMLVGTLGVVQMPAQAATIVPGDVNGDGVSNILDVAVTLRLLSGAAYNGAKQEKGMFVSGDGVANMADVVLMLRNAAGWDVELQAAQADASVAQHEESLFYYYDNYSMRVLNQNILHGGGGARALDKKTYRMQRMSVLMNKYQPDICSLQEYRWSDWYTLFEMTIFPASKYENHIVCRVDLSLNEREGAGSTPEMPLYIEEKMAIFWNDERFDLCQDSDGNPIKGNFWFSDTPDVMSTYFGCTQSVGQDSNGNYIDGRQRQCIWIKLHDNHTGKEFYYYAVHGPNAADTAAGVEASLIPAVKLINERVHLNFEKYGEAPVICGGDFNLNYALACDRVAYDQFVGYGYKDLAVATGNMQGTFPSFGSNVNPDGTIAARIDFFFTYNDDKLTAANYKVLEETYDENLNELENFGGFNPEGTMDGEDRFFGYWVSDHLGICADLVLT